MPIFNQVVQGGGGSGPAHYIEKDVDANGKLVSSSNVIDLTGVTDIGYYALYYSYYGINNFPANTTIDLSPIKTMTGDYCCGSMFHGTNIVSADLSGLESITGSYACMSMFNGSVSLESVDVPKLKTISGSFACQQMFSGCSKLASINFDSLETAAANSMTGMFSNCTYLQNIYLNKFNPVAQICPSWSTTFNGCIKLENVYLGGLVAATFGSVQNQFQYLFGNTTGSSAPNGCTVHFPSNFDPSDPSHTFDVSTLAGYPTFGGNASYIHVAFDLPATE